jgi:hypothetical protein
MFVMFILLWKQICWSPCRRRYILVLYSGTEFSSGVSFIWHFCLFSYLFGVPKQVPIGFFGLNLVEPSEAW